LYVYMSKCCLINVTSKHEERLTFDRMKSKSIPQTVNANDMNANKSSLNS